MNHTVSTGQGYLNTAYPFTSLDFRRIGRGIAEALSGRQIVLIARGVAKQ